MVLWTCEITRQRLFSHEIRFELQWRIVIEIFELERRRLRRVCTLQFSIPEQGEEAWLVPVFYWHTDCYFIWYRISITKCAAYRRKWLEGHVAPPPPPPISQFWGQGIHTAISLRDLRDASVGKHLWTITWIAQFKLAFVMLICVHMGQNNVIRITVTEMIILIVKKSDEHVGLFFFANCQCHQKIYTRCTMQTSQHFK